MKIKEFKQIKFDKGTGWLLPGIYSITLSNLRKHPVLSKGQKRLQLINNLTLACETYWKHGITEIYVNGSFASTKESPGDIDGYIVIKDFNDINFIELINSNSIWGDFSTINSETGKFKMWDEYKIEFYVHPMQKVFGGMNFPDFFTNPNKYVTKSILKIIKEK